MLEATRQVESAIKQQPKKAPMDETTAIEMLKQVIAGEQKGKVPLIE